MKPIVVNIFAGPGSGKSTTAAALFAYLKFDGTNVELAQEYAKELVWLEKEMNQDEIFQVTKERLTIANKVDFLITDGPILQQLAYTNDFEMSKAIKSEHEKYFNINFFIERSDARTFNKSGRTQTESQARELDLEIKEMLVAQNQKVFNIKFSKNAPIEMADIISEQIIGNL